MSYWITKLRQFYKKQITILWNVSPWDFSQRTYISSGTYGCYQASGPSSGTSQSHMWNTQNIPPSTPAQQYGSNRPAPGPAPGPAPAMRHYAPISHPYKAGGTGYVSPTFWPFVHYDGQWVDKKQTNKEIHMVFKSLKSECNMWLMFGACGASF